MRQAPSSPYSRFQNSVDTRDSLPLKMGFLYLDTTKRTNRRVYSLILTQNIAGKRRDISVASVRPTASESGYGTVLEVMTTE